MSADIALVKGGRSLWQEGQLLDFTIEVDNQAFKVHKFVMASVSDYFRAMLTGGMVESLEDRVKLQGFSPEVVSDIINFIYTNQLGEKSISNLRDLLDCAIYLQISAAIEKCTEDLCQKVDENSCFHILSIFKSYSLENGIQSARDYIKSSMQTILDACATGNLSHHNLLDVIDCWERSEWDLFVIVKTWISADYWDRKEHVNDLMTRIRFCLMSPAEVKCVKDLELYSDSDRSWHDLVEKALIYHKLPIHQKVLDDSVQTQIRTESASVFVIDLEHNAYGLDQGSHNSALHRYDDVISPHITCLPCDIIEANNFLFVFYRIYNQCYIFDPRTLLWFTVPESAIRRWGCALVYHEKHLFTLGGRDNRNQPSTTDIIEKYDFETDTWDIVKSRQPVPLMDHYAFSISDSIFILGGRSEKSNTHFMARVDCFHSISETWEVRSPMLDTGQMFESTIQVLELFGEKVITVFDRNLSLQYYKPSTDQWSMWRCPGIGISRLSSDTRGRVVARGNSLFLLNLMRGKTEGACEKWTFCESGLEKVDRLPDVRNVMRPYLCGTLNMIR